ncbi:hypothetical protein F5888DRAFT_1309200 [Russula emetica]|nr:hypothetical protein F5888DRAFT_1309200 [Russula emetica]
MTNQHPGLYSLARPPSPHNTQVLSHHHMPVQLGVGQAFAYQGTRGGSSGAQIPFNPHHGAHPVNTMPVNPPRSLHPGYNTPMANKPDIPRQSLADFYAAQNSHQGHDQGITGWHPQMTQSLGACALHGLQVAIPPQQSPPKDLSNLSTATAQPSQPASVLSFEDASSPNYSSVCEEAGSKETVFKLATETCPFPGCKKKCGRFQELERHIWERHLPPHLYCEQPGCNLTWTRPYLLKSHHTEKHPGVPMPEQDALMIYDAKALSKQVRSKEIGIEQAVHDACSLFEEKARQMGKLGIWRWMN